MKTINVESISRSCLLIVSGILLLNRIFLVEMFSALPDYRHLITLSFFCLSIASGIVITISEKVKSKKVRIEVILYYFVQLIIGAGYAVYVSIYHNTRLLNIVTSAFYFNIIFIYLFDVIYAIRMLKTARSLKSEKTDIQE